MKKLFLEKRPWRKNTQGLLKKALGEKQNKRALLEKPRKFQIFWAFKTRVYEGELGEKI